MTEDTDTTIEHSASAEGGFHAGYVTIIGDPNVGKSTLMNAVIGQKISIVTNKPQTTRHKILGILSTEKCQAIFLDTPGLLLPKYELHKAMMGAVRSAIAEADIVLLMIDCTDPRMAREIDHATIFEMLKKSKKPAYLVINKIDRVDKREILPVITFYSEKFSFEEIFPISALNDFGVKDLVSSIAESLPLHPPYYPLDIVSEHPERFFVSEIVREKIFEMFREEIPYSTTVDIIDFKEEEGKKDVISAEIYVERDSQKGILIGSGGKALKQVGELARKDIELFLGRPVFLQIHVKVREKWRDDPLWVKRLGYKT